MAFTVAPAEVEQALRRRVDRQRGFAAFSYKMLTGSPVFTLGSEAVSLAYVEDLDAPRKCELVAALAAERFNLGIACGWVAVGESIEDAQVVLHYWNFDGRRVVDAALARRRPIAYLGKTLSKAEAGVISRTKFLHAFG